MLLQYRSEAASGVLALGDEWKVRASADLLEQLEGLMGCGAARFGYGHVFEDRDAEGGAILLGVAGSII